MKNSDNKSGRKSGRDGGNDSNQVRGSANSAKAKVKGNVNFTEANASKKPHYHLSKNKRGGEKHWQGPKGQQRDGQKLITNRLHPITGGLPRWRT